MTQPKSSYPNLIALDEAISILKEMDKALAYHLQWLKVLHRILVCDETINVNDVAPDAHDRCEFGKWYRNLPKALLAKEPDIRKLDGPHHKMHDAARELLLAHAQKKPVEPSVYEHFMSLAIGFKQKMREYQLNLVQRVCSVDQLTGAWNRNAMASRLAEEIHRAQRGARSFSLCLLDLDHFKLINDNYGHPVGDQVLHFVAGFLKENLRVYDSMFRYGGEEFLICLPDSDLDQAQRLIDRVRAKLADTVIELPEQPAMRITASFGIAAMNTDDDISLMIEHADHALLCAKARGRNQVCVWDIGGG